MTRAAFEEAFARTVWKEGGDKFSNNKNDSGGQTRYGITERVAREEGYAGPMNQLPLSIAKGIAKRRYWDQLSLDRVSDLAPVVAEELFDTSYNMGQGVAGRFLQRALNGFNLFGTIYPDLTEDGIIGSGTISALAAYLKHRGRLGETVLVRALNCLQGAQYFAIAQNRPKDEEFVYGWMLNRVVV
jgi:lysozyme family protein